MNLSKKETAAISKAYDTWLSSYISGDVETYDSYFDEAYHFIGSTNNEEYLSRKETTDFLRKTADQLAGKTELRNNKKTFEKQGSIVLITHFFDAYFLNETEWTYYDRFRFSSAMHYTERGWLFIYQHFSTPDGNAEEGETIGYDQISAENKELREAINRRTVELENKTRDLEIQNSLERIRGIAMGMSKPEDLLEIAESIFTELKKHGFESLRNTMINIYQDQLDSLLNYDFSPNSGKTLTTIQYKSHPLTENLIKETRSSKDIFSEFQVKGKKLQEWRDYRKGMGENDDPALENISILSYYFFSFAAGSIGISTYEPISSDKLEILKSFKNTFELTYKRYLDIQNALAQARESQIEAALERLRARSLSMQKSEELADASILLEEEVRKLGIENWGCAFHIYDEETTSGKPWDLEWFTSMAGILPFYKTPRENIFLRYYEESKKGNPLYIQEFGPEVIKEHYDYLKTLPVLGEALTDLHNSGVPLPEKQIDHVAFFNHGHLLFITYKPVPEAHDIFIRFAKVFNQAYTRFLDLEKAEKQAREAQIEAALERIRGQVASMRESTELLEIMVSMRKEFVALGHEANYFWHMQWLPESYEKAMTSGDGTQIGMVMSLPRRIHGDIQLVADWEKGTDPILVLAMETETAVDYVHKMITWGDFEKVDPQAPTLDDIRHIGGLTFVMARTSHGEIGYSLPGSVPNPPKEAMDTLVRFAKVFDLAYKRFEDLKKAEHQTRETQIELALERVRSRSMAMQKSEELKEVIQVVYDQFISLNILVEHTGFILDYKDREDMFIWLADKNGVPSQITLPYFDCPHWNSFLEAKKNGGNFFANLHTFEEKNRFYEDLFKLIPDAAEGLREIYLSYPGLAISTVLLDNIGLYIENFESKPYTPQENAILMRFGKVFQQTYTRFLDLKRAEAQAREAQIEAGLERVRSRSMAMHRTEELQEAAEVLNTELNRLGIQNINQCGYAIYNEEENNQVLWLTKPDGTSREEFTLPKTGETILNDRYEAWKNQEPFFHQKATTDQFKHHLQLVFDQLDSEVAKAIATKEMPNNPHFYCANFRDGYLHIVADEELEEEQKQIMVRFARVFSQTYTRFLDLQKAEKQAREAQINLAVERVRARALAMFQSEEILDVVFKLKQEVMGLDIPGVAASTIFIKEPKGNHRMWDLSSLELTNEKLHLPFDISFKLENTDPNFYAHRIFEKKEKYFLVVQDLQDLQVTFQWLRDHGKSKEADEADQFVKSTGMKNLFHPTVTLESGRMCLDLLDPPSEEIELILTKMGAAFDLAYKRFEDLKKSEEQLREAQIESSLEKVRSRTLAMQSSEELAETAAVLFAQLIALGVDHERINIAIVSEENQNVEFWSTEQGGNLIKTRFEASIHEATVINKLYRAWKEEKETLTVQLKGQELQSWVSYCENEIGIPFDKKLLQDQRVQSAAFFSKGMLMLTTHTLPPASTLSLLVRFASVFNLTFTRFNDLKIAEANALKAEKDLIAIKDAKKKAEDALLELKAAQEQLIQQEKLASLGQLTAGIAHEIKNPLNFVNNFSELSSELIEEVFEELENLESSDTKEEIIAILEDVKSNLAKVHEHGTRADGIVKSMLQHSRASNNKMESKAINPIIKEFVNLAFHGMRAAKNPINVTIDLQLKEEVGELKIISEDFSRVILNLCNNAFDAMRDKINALGSENYEAKLTVNTYRSNGKVMLDFIDNGPGIPEEILGKILQPFFTTKKGTEGTGLGLSITHDIIKAHGGSLLVSSKVNDGTKMTILLPLDPR
ncbi:ATP-binding protein [Algoriphagus pacificus]|uniref:histidine kinase n=1 Tax=Algoriphagus pacificus TaxID=2811234 RepID=A0ABS3CBX6_9BACT|nr:ATP-binding protein [Algoriphagus pacificus]MBN7814613.1 nuclear transport factor 2 family protein [Algoriphagus pacificus]